MTEHSYCGCRSCVEQRALAAEAENDRLRKALATVDAFLTTAKGDNIPRGETCKMHAREIARIALHRSQNCNCCKTPGIKAWFCPNHGYTVNVAHGSHDQARYCLDCKSDVRPIGDGGLGA